METKQRIWHFYATIRYINFITGGGGGGRVEKFGDSGSTFYQRVTANNIGICIEIQSQNLTTHNMFSSVQIMM